MVIRLGRNGRFLACSLFPEHKESRPLPGEEPPPQAGEGEVCPQCGEGTLVGKRGKFGPFVGCSRYPDCTYIRKEGPPPPDPLGFEVAVPEEPRRHARPASRAADRQRLLRVLELPEVRLHDELRPGRGGPRRGRRARRAARRDGDLPGVRRGRAAAGGRGPRRTRGSRADRRTRRRSPGPPAAAPVAARRVAAARGGRRRGRRPARSGWLDTRRAPDGAQDRDRTRRVRRTRRCSAPVPGAADDRRLGRRRAGGYLGRSPRATPRRTPSGRTDARSGPTSTGSTPAASTGGRPAAATCAPTSPCSGWATPAARRPSGSRRSARSTASRPGTASPPGDPWGAIATPRLPRRLPRVLEVDEVERLLAAVDEELAEPAARAGGLGARDRAARPGDRRDRLCRRAPDQRAGRGRSRVARPPPGRDPGPRQGPEGADRAARPAGPGGARGVPPGRPARPRRPVRADAAGRRRRTDRVS